MLAEKFGDADWVYQAAETVALAAQRAIDHLSGMSVLTASTVSLRDGGEYAMPARTKEELLSSQNAAASSREIPREAKKKDLQDPAQAVSPGEEPVRNNGRNGRIIIVPSGRLEPPGEEPPKKWLM